MREPVSKAVIQKMIELYKRGYNRLEIAHATGYAPETVSKYMKKHQYSFAEGRSPIREMTGPCIYLEDLKRCKYGVEVGDKIVVKSREARDEKGKVITKTVKGTVEGMQDLFITVMTDKGYRITVAKIDLATKRNSMTKV